MKIQLYSMARSFLHIGCVVQFAVSFVSWSCARWSVSRLIRQSDKCSPSLTSLVFGGSCSIALLLVGARRGADCLSLGDRSPSMNGISIMPPRWIRITSSSSL
jgi:hypothetical protein